MQFDAALALHLAAPVSLTVRLDKYYRDQTYPGVSARITD